jgi:hypothetical protein
MKIRHPIVIFFLLVIVGICGCTQPVSDTGTKLVFESPSIPTTAVTSVPVPIMTPSSIPKDPVVGNWYCFVYPSWGGKVLNEFSLKENQTWDRVITEYQDKIEKEYAHGVWKKESTNRYSLKSSKTQNTHTFEYDKTKDELFDTDFKLLYHRVV